MGVCKDMKKAVLTYELAMDMGCVDAVIICVVEDEESKNHNSG